MITLGIYFIGALSGGVLCYGLGYDKCFKNKIEIDRDTEYLIVRREEFLNMARQELKGGNPLGKMSDDYYRTARKFAVKVGVHNDC